MAKFTSATAPRHKAGEPRKLRQRKEPLPIERKAYTIPEFCLAHCLSRSRYYQLKVEGLAPDETQDTPHGKITITEEAATRWRAKREAASVAVKVKPATSPPPVPPTKPEKARAKVKPTGATRRAEEVSA